ncbi:hypothetical protein [Sphingobacterium pedocola]|uniref:DUF4350 domain-containing protein n=1 Tax=Sphingobacterium pedocola TaxID=2082722 RepID=A0ABR9T9V9_9SPHI|nr:hypothetical protein [Sphingobacterium pedocola]MBE8722126.1 hypothetical protein [Sphingobacterium pedocola]
MKQYLKCYLVAITVYLFLPVLSLCQTVSDPNFIVRLTDPVYPDKEGPLVYYDTYHNNPFSITGQYKAFADILSADGYRVKELNQKLNKEVLQKASIFVTVSALSHLENWDLPNPPVYSQEEIDLLYTWVYDEGGSLFLITDHMPAAGAVSSLAARFGFNVINGFTQRKDNGVEIFSRSRGNLLASVVTDVADKRIDSIRCWGSIGFIAPVEAEVFSLLGGEYDIFLPTQVGQMDHPLRNNIPFISGRHIANGAILQCGKGRVCVFADGAPFTALLQSIKSEKRGMNHPDAAQHVQFLRNIIHWLDNRL